MSNSNRYIKRKEIECDSCGSDVATKQTAKSTIAPLTEEDRDEYLCPFCYETLLGNVIRYKHYPGDLRTMARGICQAMNIIMTEIHS